MTPELEVNPELHQIVLIENIFPSICSKGFSLKAIAGDTIEVEADVFSHGANSLAVRIIFKQETDETWSETFMTSIGNDRWEGRFLLANEGKYEFCIKAWIDRAAAWQQEIISTIQNYKQVDGFIPEGVVLLEGMLKRAAQDDQPLIKEALRLFANEKRIEESAQLAASFRFTEWRNRYPEIKSASETQVFGIRSYRKKLEFSTWYTMFPRSASAEPGRYGTFQDVARLLPHIADLGFDVLLFPPINPIGISDRKGQNGAKSANAMDPGSPYVVGNQFGGHETIDSNLGTLADLKDLISSAKALGIEIALDLSLQFSHEHPWVEQHKDLFGKTINNNTYSGVENPLKLTVDEGNWDFAKKAVTEIILLWASWGIRIIKVDEPENQPLEWWRELIAGIESVYPDLILYAGTFTRPKIMGYLAKSGFALSDSYFMWRNNRFEIEQYIRELTKSDLKGSYRPIFWTNTPKINPYNLQSGHEPQQLIRFFLAATLSGSYGIYGPVFEQLVYESFPGKEKYWNSELFEIKHWDWEKETKLTYLIRMINKIRKENPALQQMLNMEICDVQNENILAYIKTKSSENTVLCVVNLDAYHRQSGMVHVPLHLTGKNWDQEYTAHDLVTDAKYVWKGEWNYVELDPFILPFHILRIEDYRGELGV